jgi:site-specific recombinase XerD
MPSEDNRKMYLERLKGRKSKHTIRAYESTLDAYFTFLNEKNIDVDAESVELFLSNQLEEKNNAATLNRHLFAIRSYFKFLGRENEVKDIEPYKRKVKKEIKVDWNKLTKLVNYCILPYEKMLVSTLLVTGARIGEIALLTKSNYNLEETTGVITIPTEKQKTIGNKRSVPVKSGWAIKIMKETLPLIETNKVFGERSEDLLRHDLYAIGKRARMKVWPHLFRHALITHLDDLGVPITTIQKIAGHTRVETTLIYVHKSLEEITKNMPEL